MTEGPVQRSTRVPRLLRIWPLSIMLAAVTTLLVLLAVFIDSDVTRVALPTIVGAIGTISLAAVTVRLSINEQVHQDQLRRADEAAARVEASHQKEIKAAEERAASERERELELAAALRQARRVAAFTGSEEPPAGSGDPKKNTVTLINGSDYPIFDIGLIGARDEPLGEKITHTEWPPEVKLESELLYVAVLMPGERHVFRGAWTWRQDHVFKRGTVSERRATYTWTDDQGRAWQRDGSEAPKPLRQPWAWKEIWGDAEYGTEPTIEP